MFLALAAAAIAGGVIVWQWITNQPNDGSEPTDEVAPAPPPSTLNWAPRPTPPELKAPPVKTLQQRAKECGATLQDFLYAEKWSALYLGNVIDLRARLAQMHQIVPFHTWSIAARRVWCAIR